MERRLLAAARRSLPPRRGAKHRQFRGGFGEHDSPPTSVAVPERCCAPGVFRHSTPHRVVQVYQRKPAQTTRKYAKAGIRRYTGPELSKWRSLLQQTAQRRPTSKTVFRNTTRCLKLTEDEARLVDEVATAKGVPRSEWMRDVILRELRCEPAPDRFAGGDSWRSPAVGQCPATARRRPEHVARSVRQTA